MKRMLLCMAAAALLLPAVAWSGERYTMASIPKLRSVWFNRFETGLIEAGKRFGVEVYQQAPAGADEAQQVRLIEDAVSQGVNAILVVPNDASSIVPAIRRAKERGMVVMTNESMNQEGADWNIEMFDNAAYGEIAMDELAKLMNYEGEYVCFVGSLTVPAHNIRADAGIAKQKRDYPKMTMVGSKFPVSEDRNLARQTLLDILQTYPNLKGVYIFGSQGGPGAGQALREKNMNDQIKIVAGGTPRELGPFFDDGCIDVGTLWDPSEAAYAMVYIAQMVLDGKSDQIHVGMEIPGLGNIATIHGNNILFNNPKIVTKDNYKQYDY
ncbi:MAG: substrate-binding domain-containing protein [Planctomycetes bacterium]|nr:substrate-binding domain-containing protein [Planctomycetota bacterium]